LDCELSNCRGLGARFVTSVFFCLIRLKIPNKRQRRKRRVLLGAGAVCGSAATIGRDESCQSRFAERIILMKLRAWNEKNLPSITHAIRTAVAATASVLIARLVQMPEAYWAAIATLVVMQSTLGATLTLSLERIVATAMGASVGALEVNVFGANLVAFAVAIVLIGLLSIAFRLEKTAYRYASITLAIHRSDSAFGTGVDYRVTQVS
jgi:uncharacterized membrane protein YccC